MVRPVTLFTGQWTELLSEEMARKASEFGHDGIEFAFTGGLFQVDEPRTDDNYSPQKRSHLGRDGVPYPLGGKTVTQRPPKDRSKSPRQAFLCYSKTDRKWLDRFVTHMKPWLRNANPSLSLWDDSQIETGDRWELGIELALGRSTDAVLFVSPDLLASEYVMDCELPYLLNAAESGRIRITWLHVRASAYETQNS